MVGFSHLDTFSTRYNMVREVSTLHVFLTPEIMHQINLQVLFLYPFVTDKEVKLLNLFTSKTGG